MNAKLIGAAALTALAFATAASADPVVHPNPTGTVLGLATARTAAAVYSSTTAPSGNVATATLLGEDPPSLPANACLLLSALGAIGLVASRRGSGGR